MDDEIADDWVVIVPASNPIVADSLWQEWVSRQDGELSTEDFLVDCIRAVGGDLRRYRVKGQAPMSSQEFADVLAVGCRTARTIVSEHLDEWNGEILNTLLVSDLRRHLEEDFEGARDSECSCLDAMDLAMCEGDAGVQNAVAVCFVEDSCWYDPASQPFIESWPAALRSEVDRQRTSPSSILRDLD